MVFQTVMVLNVAVFQKFISPGELDPLNRRQVTETKPEVVVQGNYCKITKNLNLTSLL